MKVTTSKQIGDYQVELLDDCRFQNDFPNWMSKVANKLAQETLNDMQEKRGKYPELEKDNCCIAFEVTVSISTFPKTNKNDDSTD